MNVGLGDLLSIKFSLKPIRGDSVLFGFALLALKPERRCVTKDGLSRFSECFFEFTNLIMKFAPLGAFGSVAYAVGSNGSAVLMALTNLGLVVLPTGYAFNLDGTSIYMSLCVLFIVNAYGVPMSWEQQLGTIAIMLVTSKGGGVRWQLRGVYRNGHGDPRVAGGKSGAAVRRLPPHVDGDRHLQHHRQQRGNRGGVELVRRVHRTNRQG